MSTAPRTRAELRAAAERIGRDTAARFADAVDREARFPAETLAAIKHERLLGILFPPELGGEAAPLAFAAEICATLGRYCASSAMIYAMHQSHAYCVLVHGSGSEWHRDFMRRTASEQLLLASATTEVGIGGELGRSASAIEVDGSRFAVTKNAPTISYGREADAMLFTARRGPDAAANDQVFVAAYRDQYRLEQTGDWDTLGMRGTCSAGFLLHVDAGIGQILPEPFASIAARSMVAATHLLWASVWFGIATDAVARAQAYLRAEARQQRGESSPGALRLAEASGALRAVKSNIIAALGSLDDTNAERSFGFAVAMNELKVIVADAVTAIIGRCLLVCGMAGYANQGPYSLGRHLRDAHSAALMISNDRILRNNASLVLTYRHTTHLAGDGED